VSAEGGFTLIEALVALFILSIVSLSMAQMIGMGLMVDANSEHLTSATTLSVNKLEELRNSDYASLTAGGDLTSDSNGYFDAPDLNGDGTADFTRRWVITDQAGGKSIQVRVIARLDIVGPKREATMATVVAER
jgi:prepilin-type N-terminal cleavage/methylation domain-containing protein